MSKRAEERAVEYQIKTYGPNVVGGASMLSEEEYMRFNMNLDFKNGYEQAEKETLERVIEWWRPRLCGFLKEGLTEGVLGEFRKAMEEEL